MKYRWGLKVKAMRSNSILTELWSKNMDTLGTKLKSGMRLNIPLAVLIWAMLAPLYLVFTRT